MVFAPFMPTACWMAPEMPEGQVQLRRHGLPGAADLPLERQPAGVADRPRGRDLGAERLGELLGERELLLLLDPAADGHDALGLGQVHRLLRLAERRFGLLSDGRGVEGQRQRGDTGAGAGAPRARRRPGNAPACTVTRHGASPSGVTSAAIFPWKTRRVKAGRPRGVGEPDDVGDQRALEPGGQLRHEVARLVGVRRRARRPAPARR